MILTVFNGLAYAAEDFEPVVEEVTDQDFIDEVEPEEPVEEVVEPEEEVEIEEPVEETTEPEEEVVVEELVEEALELEISEEKVEEPVNNFYNENSYISDVTVGRYYITGYTNPYATVKLYSKAGSLLGTTKADSYGYFSMDHPYNWEYHYYDYYYDLVDGYLVSTTGYDTVTKYLSRSNVTWSPDYNYNPWYDWRYEDLNYGYYDKYGYWHYYDWYLNDAYGCWKDGSWCWYDRYNNPDFGYWYNGKWYFYDWYYNDDYGYWKDGRWYWYNWYNDDDYGYWYNSKWYWYDQYENIVGTNTNTNKPVDYTNYTNIFTIGSNTYTTVVNGVKFTKTMDVSPYTENGRTMLPLRYIADSLGYEVTFDENTDNAIFIKGNDVIIINLYSKEFKVNQKTYTLSELPKTVNGRIMLPISEIGRALGLESGNLGSGKAIQWDSLNQQVIIKTKR